MRNAVRPFKFTSVCKMIGLLGSKYFSIYTLLISCFTVSNASVCSESFTKGAFVLVSSLKLSPPLPVLESIC